MYIVNYLLNEPHHLHLVDKHMKTLEDRKDSCGGYKYEYERYLDECNWGAKQEWVHSKNTEIKFYVDQYKEEFDKHKRNWDHYIRNKDIDPNLFKRLNGLLHGKYGHCFQMYHLTSDWRQEDMLQSARGYKESRW